MPEIRIDSLATPLSEVRHRADSRRAVHRISGQPGERCSHAPPASLSIVSQVLCAACKP